MKAGFAAVLGRPNVGKSTLLNALVGSKVSIVSPKPQTTREAIQGILSREDGQIVFVDSPGIHAATRQELGRRMVREIERAASGCHCVILVVDASQPIGLGDKAAIEKVKQLGVPAILALNKVDKLKDKKLLLPKIEQYQALYPFDEFVPISALKGLQVDKIADLVLARLPESPAYYPDDYITDQPERFLAAELIRERIFIETHEEVPHSTTVLIDNWDESPRLLKLSATVYVERSGQKAIVIGKQGELMKRIATKARESLEERFGRKVFLEVFVKVKPKWRDAPGFMRTLDQHRYGVGAAEDESDEPAFFAGDEDLLEDEDNSLA
ncbi:MAG: GTPase Era [Acidobacteria bacterium]|nr:GTPase Era [Acidobacteriota bacterium]